MLIILDVDPKQEVQKIIKFIRKTTYSAGFSKVIIPLSGGVDSSTVTFLVVKALGVKNVLIARLPYKGLNTENDVDLIIKTLKIPKKNVFEIDIKAMVDLLFERSPVPYGTGRSRELLQNVIPAPALSETEEKAGIYIDSDFRQNDNESKIRLGNIMARVRMIILYDLAKANEALVCGTENKSEYLLGYYTLHGDSASDLEPIRHLYKTQVHQLARYLGVPKEIIAKPPTAGLWKGQTDEGELGFSYAEADPILYLLFDKKYSEEKILKMGYKKELVKKVICHVKTNSFKEKIPYHLGNTLVETLTRY